MKTNANSRYTVAVLIDGDNASFERMEDIMGFVSRYGDAVVRRIYGDWTRKALSAWKESAREHGFRLVQASSHVPGKNTTDIALVIDAMDILRDGQVDCFCLVASDGDYSLLAQFCILASLGLLNGRLRQHVKCFIKCLDGSMPFFACRQRWQIKGLCLPIHIKNDVYRIIGSSIRFLRIISGSQHT